MKLNDLIKNITYLIENYIQIENKYKFNITCVIACVLRIHIG